MCIRKNLVYTKCHHSRVAFTFRCDRQTKTIFGIRSSMTDCKDFQESDTEQESLCPSCARKEATRGALQAQPSGLERRLGNQRCTSSCGSSTASRSTRSSTFSHSSGSVVSRASTTPSEHDAMESSMQAIISMKVKDSTRAFEAAGGMRGLTVGSPVVSQLSSARRSRVEGKTNEAVPATLAVAVTITNARASMVDVSPAHSPIKGDIAGAAMRAAFTPNFNETPVKAKATVAKIAAPTQACEDPRVSRFYYTPYRGRPSLEDMGKIRDADAVSIVSTGPDFGSESSCRLQRTDSLFLPSCQVENKTCNEGRRGEVAQSSPAEILKPGAARRDDRASLPSSRRIEPSLAPRIMPVILEPSNVGNDYAKLCADIVIKQEAERQHVSLQRSSAGQAQHKNFSLPSRALTRKIEGVTTAAAKTRPTERMPHRRADARTSDQPLPDRPKHKSWEANDDHQTLSTRVRRSRPTSTKSSCLPEETPKPSSAPRKIRSQPVERSKQGDDDDDIFFIPRRPRPTLLESAPRSSQSTSVSGATTGEKTLRRSKALPAKDAMPDYRA